MTFHGEKTLIQRGDIILWHERGEGESTISITRTTERGIDTLYWEAGGREKWLRALNASDEFFDVAATLADALSLELRARNDFRHQAFEFV